MEKISEMIQRLCPDGVKHVRIGEVVNILDSQRKPVSKDSRVAGMYPYYGANGIQDYVDDYIFDGTYILLGEDGSVINNDKSPVLHWVSGKIWVNNHAHILEDANLIELRYIYYALTMTDVSDIVRGTPPKLNQANLRNIEIPLPPLPIQQEIVRILDSFTSMITNLETELASRQKQYEYYRDQLFGEDVDALINRIDCEVKTISELGSLTRGKRFVRTDIVEEGVPCIHYGDMYTFYGLNAKAAKTYITKEKAKSMRFAKKGDVVIVGAGENDWDIGVGLVWLGDEDAAIHDACYILEHDQNAMYISHYLRSTVYHLQLRMYVSSGKISSFSSRDLGRILIPIPTKERQQEIVSTLDTFESLITNIKQELNARKKQYEYYREKLLTFE